MPETAAVEPLTEAAAVAVADVTLRTVHAVALGQVDRVPPIDQLRALTPSELWAQVLLLLALAEAYGATPSPYDDETTPAQEVADGMLGASLGGDYDLVVFYWNEAAEADAGTDVWLALVELAADALRGIVLAVAQPGDGAAGDV